MKNRANSSTNQQIRSTSGQAFRRAGKVLVLMVVILVGVMVVGKMYGGMKEDKFCVTKHVPTTTKPKDLVTAQDWLYTGDYDFESGNCEQAISDLNMAIGINPKYAEAYNNRGYIKTRLKRYAEALPDFDKAIELRPGYPHALMNRGDLYNYYLVVKDKTKAMADYDRVIALGKETIKSEAVCGHRDMATYEGNFVRAIFNAVLRKGECWKLYFEK
ncbi:tetratricopeptide repeat protein [Candidatus Shapirobacteria bacterium]|nr:tetratricopeptide repeat protein [Candidatus Shapirobacteria bacterium]